MRLPAIQASRKMPSSPPSRVGTSPQFSATTTSPAPADMESLDAAARLADLATDREAAELCQDHVDQAGPSARAFDLLGMIEDAEDRADQAQAHYRKAVYLDPGHADTLRQLAHHARRAGDNAGAERFQRRARRSTEKAAT